jgi:signal-transduction protein with cAMP-binding, CBS, and nucleotidyltransferase domain
MKRLVRDLIRQKELLGFANVSPTASVFEALSVLESQKCSALLVMEGSQLQGVFSEKDFARAYMNKGIQLSESVANVMTTQIYYVEPTFTLEDCLKVMSKVHVRHLPVIENSKPIALLSMRHIMEILVEDKEAKIRELTTYITGNSLIGDSNLDQREFKVPVYYKDKGVEAS